MPANVAFPTLSPNLAHRCYTVSHPWLYCIQILDVLHPNGRISWPQCIHGLSHPTHPSPREVACEALFLGAMEGGN
jgi:hypothetical protein